MRFLVLILIGVFLNISLSRAEIEVYSAGKYFKSIQEYKDRHQLATDKFKIRGPVVESRLVPLISRVDLKKLDQISYNHAIDQKISDFKVVGHNEKSRFVLDSNEIEEVIRNTMEKSKEPALIISDQGKMRIISFSQKDKLSSNLEETNKQKD